MSDHYRRFHDNRLFLEKDEEINTEFPKNASWKAVSWESMDDKAYHGKIYITDKRIIFEGEKAGKNQEKIKIGLSRFAEVYMELDTEDRERVCTYFEELMDIVGLESSSGQLNKFMYGFDPNEMTNKN